MAKTERDCWLDWCRVFAICTIVLTHCVEQFYPLSVVTSCSYEHKIFVIFLFTIGRLGVPVFLFLSGYLLPSRHVITCEDDYWQFIRKKWIPLFVCVEIWILIYGLILFVYSREIHWYDILRWMIFNRFIPLSHWWYMPMILGTYLAVPLLSLISKGLGRKFILSATIISTFVYVVRPMIHVCVLDFSFVGDCYFTYILWGYTVCLYREKIFEYLRKPIIVIGLFLLFALNIVVCLYYQIGSGIPSFIWYSAPCLITAGMVVPLLLRTLPGVKLSFLVTVSINSFGVYFLHNLVLKALKPLFSLCTNGFLRCLVAWIIAMTVSLSVMAILNRFPKIRRTIFLIK